MSLFNKSLIVVLAMGFAGAAVAEDAESSQSESKVKIEDMAKEKKADGIDKEITNARMRADSGSKSKYSMSATLGYSGGSVAKPFADDRPDIYGSNVRPEVSLGGSIAARYRMDKNRSFTFGTGISVIQPFHEPAEELNHKDYADKTEVSDPYLGFNYAGKVGDFQTVASTSVSLTTSPRYTKWGDVGTIGASLTALRGFQATKWQVGVSLSTSYTHYLLDEKDLVEVKNEKGQIGYVTAQDYQSDWGVGLYPFAEYPFNDVYSFRTVIGVAAFVHDKVNWTNSEAAGPWDLRRSGRYQSIGLGIAATRDIYIYPNVQFSLDQMMENGRFTGFRKGPDPKFTNVAVSATINVF